MFALPRDRRSIGTFVKTDSPQVIEVLALTGLNFVVLDAEHAPLDRRTLDRMIFTARAVGPAPLVRVPDHADATLLTVLDLGAVGVVVPHVDSAEEAAKVVAAARFVGGRRGLSLSARYGGYGTRPRAEAIAEGDASLVLCQIESGAAVDAVEAIAAVPGVGGLFVGRSDLALSLGLDDPMDPRVLAAVDRCARAAQARDLPVVMACGDPAEVEVFAARGAHAFVVGSDQSLLRGAAQALGALRAPIPFPIPLPLEPRKDDAR